jgi:hypothetical protein
VGLPVLSGVSSMRKLYMLGMSALAAIAGNTGAQAATDIIQANTGYFLPADTPFNASPYYREGDQDWGWTHHAIGETITSATLNVGAYDVDSPDEVDNIYALDSGTWVLLGPLTGVNNEYSYSTFDLGANFYDDIAAGLQVKVDIDALDDSWLLTLSKSVLIVNGGDLPPVAPTAAPEPASWAMMLIGFGAMGAAMRRRRTAVTYA